MFRAKHNGVYLKLQQKNPLLLGSSNLSKINLDKHPEVQVECYPGANFNHFRNLVIKASLNLKTLLLTLA